MVASKKSKSHKAVKKQTIAAKRAPSKPRTAAKASAIAAIDRRGVSNDRRSGTDRRKESKPVAVERRVLERRVKVSRRRQIDPTTCERDYTPDEIEFMGAMDEYKRRSGRMFPTCSEVLEVVKSLGYGKGSPIGVTALPNVAPFVSASPNMTAL